MISSDLLRKAINVLAIFAQERCSACKDTNSDRCHLCLSHAALHIAEDFGVELLRRSLSRKKWWR